MTVEELTHMQNINIMELEREQLVNIEDIVIDKTKSVEHRVKSYIEQAGNPFAVNVGDYIVQSGFESEVKDTIDDRMILLARRMSNISI